MTDTLQSLLESGVTVLTASRRLAYALRLGFAQTAQASGKTAWRSPQVLPWSTWLREQWLEWRRLGDPPLQLLNGAQARILWDEVVQRSDIAQSLLNPSQRSTHGSSQLAATARVLDRHGDAVASHQRRNAGTADVGARVRTSLRRHWMPSMRPDWRSWRCACSSCLSTPFVWPASMSCRRCCGRSVRCGNVQVSWSSSRMRDRDCQHRQSHGSRPRSGDRDGCGLGTRTGRCRSAAHRRGRQFAAGSSPRSTAGIRGCLCARIPTRR